jgi:hypothetical protein
MDEASEPIDFREGDLPRAPARRLRLALAGSLLVHFGALIWLGAAGPPRPLTGMPATLRLLIEGAAEGEVAPEPAEPLAADLPHEFNSLKPTAASAEAAAQSSLAGGDEAAETERGSDADAAEGGGPALVATPVESLPAVAEETEGAPERLTRSLADSERDSVLERVQAWVHELEASDPRRAQLSWQQDGVPYTAVLKRRVPALATGFERIEVEVGMPAEGGQWKTGLSLRRVAFSEYSQFVDRWDHEVQLHDDEIAGRFHANSSIIIGYDRDAAPRFLGRVTTAGRGYRVADAFGRRSREEIFQGGLETRVAPIPMPAELKPLIADAGARRNQERRFDRDTRIRFGAEGGYEWCPLRGKEPCRLEPSADGVGYLVGGPGVELHLSGTVRGQFLVYAPGYIVIEGNLRYARDPERVRETEDLLGLVAGLDVVIARPHVTGGGDLEIQAAIYARRRFVVTEEDARRAGTLRILGSLSAGSLTATEPRYATRIDFDPRFANLRPPGFPMTSRYEFEALPGEWILERPARVP